MTTDIKSFLSDELLHQVEETARAQHRKPEEVISEAVEKYLAEQSWVKLVTDGQENAKRLGIQESDVDRLIGEYRQEKRGR
jgi:predicted transcriptional regulator